MGHDSTQSGRIARLLTVGLVCAVFGVTACGPTTRRPTTGGALWGGARATAAAQSTPNPAANVRFGGISGCAPTGGVQPDSSPACVTSDLVQIDAVRATEGVGPMYLPANYAKLSGGEQQFVVIDLERVDRGIRPVAGMTAAICELAAAGAQACTDPGFSPSGLSWGGSIWAAGFPSTLEVDFAWMYDDGPGSDNIACTSPTAAGCWEHRQIILADPAGPALVAGAADAFGNTVTQYAAELQQPTGGQPVLLYSWAAAVAAGAGSPSPAAAPTRPAGWPVPVRLAGADRVSTAIAISEATWGPAGSAHHAGSVVIARSDTFPDALDAVPLAAAEQAPLLLTGPSGLDPRVSAEITRILAPGATIFVVGGADALSPQIDQTLIGAGYTVVRVAGSDRFATAVAVAHALDNPARVFLVDGDDFADALAAGPAAAADAGVVLLTNGVELPPMTAAYLAADAPTVYAVGGPAAQADPSATPIVGADRYATAAAVATRFFPAPTLAGFVTGANYPDALGAGAALAESRAPLLLVGTDTVPPATAAYVAAHPFIVTDIYGGQVTVSQAVMDLL